MLMALFIPLLLLFSLLVHPILPLLLLSACLCL
jgi:hypothetical protein